MVPSGRRNRSREVRRGLLRQYVRLQRDLTEADPASSAYQSSLHSFRQMGFVLISCGLEDDLDRLLRIRVLDGGLRFPALRESRRVPEGLHVLERRPV
jgi:hypothetical protein